MTRALPLHQAVQRLGSAGTAGEISKSAGSATSSTDSTNKSSSLSTTPGASSYTPGRGDADAPNGKENASGQLKKQDNDDSNKSSSSKSR